MKKEDKQLLIRDLCARSYYWPHVITNDGDEGHITGVEDTVEGIFTVHILEDGESYDTLLSVDKFKVCLRPFSSMTKEETDEYLKIKYQEIKNWREYKRIDTETWKNVGVVPIANLLDFLYSHHIDFNGFIEKELALPATEGMYEAK